MSKSIYKEILQAKNGTFIPLMVNNKTIDSRYNPEQYYEKMVLQINKETNFIILTGISNGILIEKILQSKPDAFVIGLELNQCDIDFVKSFDSVKKLELNEKVIFSNLADLAKNLKHYYLPAIYGNFQVLEQLPWSEINKESLPEIKKIILQTLDEITLDYSTQSHFGKIWTSNILKNIKLINNTNSISSQNYDCKKTAAIIAAGPSLDINIEKIKRHRDNYIIFSTDTAYQTLQKNNVISDFVISIDGQNLSYNHFFNKKSNKTVFLFDLCGSFSSAKNLISNKNDLYFFQSGHPLCHLLNQIGNYNLPFINNGSGTVTIAAFDIAYKLGFENFEVFGADFSYLHGKSYCKGTYLDSIYNQNACSYSNLETNFDKLMYRTELIKISENQTTTSILRSYKNSFEKYIRSLNGNFEINNKIYTVHVPATKEKIKFSNKKTDYINIIENLKKQDKQQLDLALLPLISYLRKQDHNTKSYKEYLNVAYSFIVRYN